MIPKHCWPPVCKAEWLYNLLNVVEAKHQRVPVGGYNKLINRQLQGVDTMFGVDYFRDMAKWETITDEIVFTGRIDEYFNYVCGKLEYLIAFDLL